MKVKFTLTAAFLFYCPLGHTSLWDIFRKFPIPPQAAIDACNRDSSEAEDDCEFKIKNIVLHGTCFSPDENLPLACRPNKEDQEMIPCAEK